MNIIQYFDLEVMVNEKRNIKGFELANGIKLVLISDPEINMSSCSIGIGAGYLQDEFPGTAHFLEHLLFMGSEKYSEQNDYHSYVQINGGYDNAFTGDNITCYYLSLETSFLKKGIEILSWFFRAPLLDEKHIESEMEIIDSEHSKNILSDNWIMDDIFKNFIELNSKYKKFGTGNIKSLKDIKKKDIVDFYSKYYTTDNMYVCVVDSKDIEIMIKDYLKYFDEIPIRLSDNNSKLNKFKKDKLNLIPENLIIFDFSTEYTFVNFYMIFNALETNIIEYQLILFINHLIGCEYEYSLGYYLRENDLVKSISSSIENFYDYSVNINLQLIMIDKQINNFYNGYYYLIKYINYIKNISEDQFKILYENYRKTKMLNLLYDSNSDPVEVSNKVIENMLKADIKYALIRDNNVPEYFKLIYDKFIEILDSIQIKITTNININDNKNFSKSTWYESSFLIENLKSNKIKENQITNIEFKIDNIIGIKNFIIKNNISHNVDKFLLPELINLNIDIKRQIYLLEYNKYDKPIANISVIRKNILLLNKYNKIIIGIYSSLCDKILNYFLEVMSDYKLYFSISVYGEFILYNFNGLENKLSYFVSQIIKYIHPEIIFNNSNINKYYNDIIRDVKESILNSKYNSPYTICYKYLSCMLDNNLLPDEKIKFLDSLTFDKFKENVQECLKYSKEYYIMIGLKKYGCELIVEKNTQYNYQNDSWISGIIDMLSLNPKKYLIKSNPNTNIDSNNIQDSIVFDNYKISSMNINPNEINNCLIRYWVVQKIKITNDYDKYNLELSKQIIKTKLIVNIISGIINEPLFDKIRTIDKLGYIVKSDSKITINNFDMYFNILFLVQSSYSIKRITNSIENFCEFFEKDLKSNYENYLEKFRLLKESKLIELKKPFSDLTEELSSYVESIVSKIFNFDLNQMFYDICEQIDFSKDIIPIINKIVKTESKFYDVVLEKNKK